MGCDIHLYFEMKNSKGEWEEIKFPECISPNDRDYSLFSFLADVRSYDIWDRDPQFARRGIPEDNSMPKEETEDFCMGDHSFTHAYLDEILAAPWKESKLENCYFKIFCEYIIPRLCSFTGWLNKEEERKIRVIMGFDN